jgi:hypothetical protein
VHAEEEEEEEEEEMLEEGNCNGLFKLSFHSLVCV